MPLGRLVALACLVLGLAALGTAAAHTFHASFAQVERTADGRLEVSLRFFPDDLERDLRRVTGTRVVVDDTKAFAEAFEPWLNARFALEVDGRRTTFRYVGAEVTVKTAWIYVEADWPVPLERSTMTNVLLVDLLPEQVNTVNVVEGAAHASQVFSATRTHASRLMDGQR
jgi:hypothetical protein